MTKSITKILIIEDQKDIRTLTKIILESNGYKIETAENGIEGLYMARFNQYDLILTDIIMPEMDGKQTLELLKSSKITAQVPVIAFTAHPVKDPQKEIYNFGFDGYLEKPFKIEELLHIVKKTLPQLEPILVN